MSVVASGTDSGLQSRPDPVGIGRVCPKKAAAVDAILAKFFEHPVHVQSIRETLKETEDGEE